MKILTKERILTVSMLIGAAAAVIFGGFAAFAQECQELPDRLFRLHILANSDSAEDQQLKYDLRDYIMSDLDEIFQDCTSSEEAKQAAKDSLAEIVMKCQRFVLDRGFDYIVSASVENVYFTTRSYGSLVVPAGYYDALRIVIGEGEGQNWWCVMFPPLCLGAVEEYVTADEDIMLCKSGIKSRLNGTLSFGASKRIEQNQTVEVRFKVFEILKEILGSG